MKLETNRVGSERTTLQSRPFDRAFALLTPLLARTALVVEGDDILGWSRHVGDDEADTRIAFAWVPFDLGHDVARRLC